MVFGAVFSFVDKSPGPYFSRVDGRPHVGVEIFSVFIAFEDVGSMTDQFIPRSLSDSKMKSSINSDRIFYKTAAMARFVSVDS